MTKRSPHSFMIKERVPDSMYAPISIEGRFHSYEETPRIRELRVRNTSTTLGFMRKIRSKRKSISIRLLFFLGYLSVGGCATKGIRQPSGFASVILEKTNTEEMSALGFQDSADFPGDSSNHKSILVKFNSPIPPSEDKLTLSVLGVKEDKSNQGQIPLTFGVTHQTTIYLNAKGSPKLLTKANLNKINLEVTCRYQTFLKIDENVANKIVVFGRRAQGSYGLKNNSSISTVSIRLEAPKRPTSDNLANLCEDLYTKKYQKTSREKIAQLSTNMTYRLKAEPCSYQDQSKGTGRNASCKAWYKEISSLMPESFTATTTARCVQEEHGSPQAFCRVFSRINQPCPIFVLSNQTYIENPDGEILEFATNPALIQYFCDPTQQLECQAFTNTNQSTGSMITGICQLTSNR